jgi:hypothetical protein
VTQSCVVETCPAAESESSGGTGRGQKRPLLRRAAASRYLREEWGIERAPATLAKIACTSSSGPWFYRAGRWPLYDPDHLDDWAKRLLGEPVASTSADRARDPLQAAHSPAARRGNEQTSVGSVGPRDRADNPTIARSKPASSRQLTRPSRSTSASTGSVDQ